QLLVGDGLHHGAQSFLRVLLREALLVELVGVADGGLALLGRQRAGQGQDRDAHQEAHATSVGVGEGFSRRRDAVSAKPPSELCSRLSGSVVSGAAMRSPRNRRASFAHACLGAWRQIGVALLGGKEDNRLCTRGGEIGNPKAKIRTCRATPSASC